MPMLEIDGVAIAEIGQDMVDVLMVAKSNGLGRVHNPSSFRKNTGSKLGWPSLSSMPLTLVAEFPSGESVHPR
jgi:hypothetical protein